jgi:hypothetical protein
MEKHSTEFIGLDVHKESTAIGRASAGRTAGRFVGTVGPTLAELLKSLKSLGRPEELIHRVRSRAMRLRIGARAAIARGVKRRDLPVGGIPTRQLSLQPVAIGAVVEVTRRLKPSM